MKLSRWFGDEAARVYAEIGGDAETPEAREQRELVRIMRDRGGKITVRGSRQASRRDRSTQRRQKRGEVGWWPAARPTCGPMTMMAVEADPCSFSLSQTAVTVTEMAKSPRKPHLCYRYHL